MNLDQRIEALTQSLELMALMHRDSEAQLDVRFGQVASSLNDLTLKIDIISSRLAERHEQLAVRHDQLAQRHDQLAQRHDKLAEVFKTMAELTI